MLSFVKKPIASAVSVLVFVSLILTYQNCAKPIEDLGINSSFANSCKITLSSSSVIVNGGQTIHFTYSDSIENIKIKITNHATNTFTESIYTQEGSVNVNFTQVGSYSVTGTVENDMGSSSCTASFTVISAPVPPPPAATYAWSIGGWGSCSATACGTNGVQTRGVSCLRNDNVTVADSYCGSSKPATSQGCSAPACVYTYSWSIGAWSGCSVTACGQTGTQSRSVVCYRNDGIQMADAYCGAKPAISQTCSTAPCGGGGGGGGGGCPGGVVNCQPF